MSASPVEAEATGQEFIEATFRGNTFRLPLDVDSWPLHSISIIVGARVDESQQLVVTVNHLMLAAALQELLGDQWPEFESAAPRRRHLAAASHVFAAAVGIPAGANDRVFGGIPRLLAQLARWPAHVESDLHRFWGIDYRDRWRFDADGRRLLTLRQIYTRLVEPPRESRLAIALNGGKELQSDAALAVMDLQEQLTGRRHPSRPMSKQELEARRAQAAKEESEASQHRARMQKRRDRQHIANAKANAARAQGRETPSAEEAPA